MTINDQLTDEILVSVIASDFENEVDFGQPLPFNATRPVEDQTVLNPNPVSEEPAEPAPSSNSFDEDTILPNFLKFDD